MLKVVGASWDQTRVSSMILAAVGVLGILAFIVGEMERAEDDGCYAATVVWSESAGYRVELWGQGNDLEEVPQGAARAYFRPDIERTGWAVLEVQTNPRYPDEVQAYAAGLLEGSISWQLIHWHWANTVRDACLDRPGFCEAARDFLRENDRWARDQADTRKNRSTFWYQVNLFYRQLDGMEAGWRHGVMRGAHDVDIPPEDFLWLNVAGEMADLEAKLNGSFEATGSPVAVSGAATMASAFVKLLPGRLVAGHSSAGLYRSMLRMVKRYQFNFHLSGESGAGRAPGHTIEFSSYPGAVHSQDDLYLLRSGDQDRVIGVLGTAVHNRNGSLWARLKPREQVLLGPRVMAANRLATSGRSWSRIMAGARSGPGCRQWLVLDPGRLGAGAGARRGLLYVLDQLPGVTHFSDESRALWGPGFWASLGRPFHQDMLMASGGGGGGGGGRLEAVRRAQENATSVEAVRRLMEGAAAAPAAPGRPLGPTDVKVCVLEPWEAHLHLLAGPPQHPFQWSASPFREEPHLGQPDRWDFGLLSPDWYW